MAKQATGRPDPKAREKKPARGKKEIAARKKKVHIVKKKAVIGKRKIIVKKKKTGKGQALRGRQTKPKKIAIKSRKQSPGKAAIQAGAKSDLDRFESKLSSFEGEKGALIPLLQAAQETYGYISERAISRICEVVRIPAAEIFGVITFYSQFRLKPLGKYLVKICDGTACHVNGSERIAGAIEDELQLGSADTTADGLFTLQKVACLGCCSLSPVIMINTETYGRLTPKKVQQLLKEYKSKAQNPQIA